MNREVLRALDVAVGHDRFHPVGALRGRGEGEDTGGCGAGVEVFYGRGFDRLAVHLPCIAGVEGVFHPVGADEGGASRGDVVDGLFEPPVEVHLLLGAYPHGKSYGVGSVLVGGGEGEGVSSGFFAAERVLPFCGDGRAVDLPFEGGAFGVGHLRGEGYLAALKEGVAGRGDGERDGGGAERHDVDPQFGFGLSVVGDDFEEKVDRSGLRARVGEGGCVSHRLALYRPAVCGVVADVLYPRSEGERFGDPGAVDGFVAFGNNPRRCGCMCFGDFRTRCGCTQGREGDEGKRASRFHIYKVLSVVAWGTRPYPVSDGLSRGRSRVRVKAMWAGISPAVTDHLRRPCRS